VIGQFFSERSECGLKKCPTPQGRISHLSEVADEPVTLGRPEGQNVTAPKAGHVGGIAAVRPGHCAPQALRLGDRAAGKLKGRPPRRA
jgi:hypothetical protein